MSADAGGIGRGRAGRAADASSPRWALVPAKDFARGKSRLAPALSSAARAQLARQLFDHVLGALTASGCLDGILVATDSDEVAAAARAHGAEVRRDDAGALGLAAIVDAGLRDLAARGAGAALVLMADLPQLTAHDVRALWSALDEADLVAVRAADGTHTNALVMAPPGRLPTCFGRADSFAAHLAAARAAGLRVAEIDNARIAFDVDEPQDHARLAALTLPANR